MLHMMTYETFEVLANGMITRTDAQEARVASFLPIKRASESRIEILETLAFSIAYILQTFSLVSLIVQNLFSWRFFGKKCRSITVASHSEASTFINFQWIFLEFQINFMNGKTGSRFLAQWLTRISRPGGGA